MPSFPREVQDRRRHLVGVGRQVEVPAVPDAGGPAAGGGLLGVAGVRGAEPEVADPGGGPVRRRGNGVVVEGDRQDALVPATGATDPSEGFRDFLADLPVSDDGHLPPWSTWWGPDAMAEQVPDPELRRAIEADQRVLPVAFYDHAVPTPPDWTPARVGYLRLSPAYADDADEAVARGWPTRRLDGRHLDLATRPDEVAAAIVLLADA